MNASEIIQALGSQKNICARLGLKKTAVSMWRKRGIPPRHWPALARLAAEYGYTRITIETLERHTVKEKTDAK